MANFETTIPRCVEWLERHPDGCDTTESAAGLSLSYFHVSGALCVAAERGLIRWVHAPFGKAHNRRVYFAIEHCPKVWGDASRKVNHGVKGKGLSGWKTKAKARLTEKKTDLQRQAGFGNRDCAPAGPKPIICPSTTDTRYTVHTPEPFFSAMQLGSYMRTGSVIEAAYGGTR